jgi:hypothetical protein
MRSSNQGRTGDALTFFNDEYMEITNRYAGEFAPTANAHALEEACRPIVEEMISQGGAKAISVASSYATARIVSSSQLECAPRSSCAVWTGWSSARTSVQCLTGSKSMCRSSKTCFRAQLSANRCSGRPVIEYSAWAWSRPISQPHHSR